MKLKIEIDCGNAAFDGRSCGNELAKILYRLAGNLEGMPRGAMGSYDGTKFLDINGNTVGRVKVED